MEKKPEVDGAYVEIEACDLVTRNDEACGSRILVVTNTRLEMSGEDKKSFIDKFAATREKLADEIREMDDAQASFYVLRQMLLS